MARRPRRRTVLLSLLGVAILWMIGTAYLANEARRAMSSGKDRLESVRQGATTSSLLDPKTAKDLDAADADFSRARSKLRSPVLAPLRIVPVLGRQVRAADKVVATSKGAASLAADAVDDLQELQGRDLGAGPQRVEALDDLAAIVARTRTGLAALDPGSPDALVGPLGDAVVELRSQRDETVDGLARAQQATEAVAKVLDGPTPYLLIGANNAEMRAGGGMFLSAATLGFDHGTLELGDVRPTEQLVLPAGSIPVSGDLAANWPWLDGGRDLRNMALSADFPQSAPIAAANWAKVPGGTKVGGVLVVDVDAIRGLLRVVGPVEVDGTRYTADTVRGELLRKQYARYGDDRDARRDQLGAVAKEVFARIEAGDFELDRLATALTDAVQRRNLLIWSSDPAVQRSFATAGVDGHLRSNSVSVAVLNRGAEKLDSYLDTAGTITSSTRADGRVGITVRYQLVNRAPASGPRYVVGPNIEGLVEAEHRGIVVANLPAGTTGVELRGATRTLLGSDGPTLVVAGSLDVPRGSTAEVVVTGVLPQGVRSVVLEPSARITRTRWTVDGTAYEIDRRRTLDLGR
ncbi:DUF4012 domain-containing protein [Aquihabitans sp. G128]|uniref:DUF4012 domain-containing protein n=1 Tax=Aquihabitans sp. G128 TaxID=2849779 RepID=UPI001C243920|nr:DUF4012 domain-containing protein [Aquihabitans sp. G128]QXC61341.1 DUF4012 domain-containing protein [Aquihabitans sp. G128]